jgi:hypothetical protein
MKKTKWIKLLVIAIIITTFSTFLATMPVYAAGNVGNFYYQGTTSATYSEGKSFISKLIDTISVLADYILGIFTMGIRIIFVGWAELFEFILVKTIDAVCKTDMTSSSDDIYSFKPFEGITDVSNRVTIEKIVFNKIPIFDVNIFDLSFGQDESDTETTSGSETSSGSELTTTIESNNP